MSGERFDPTPPDPEGDAERAARRADALEAAREAARRGNWEYVRREAEGERAPGPEADAADLVARIEEAPDLAALARLAPAPVLPTVADWTGTPAPRAWLAPAWLPTGRAALFTGPGGSGKSLLALQLAAAVAGGNRNPFRSDPRTGADQAPRLPGIEPGPALFATWEDEPSEVLRRLAWARVDRGALGDRLHVAHLAGRGPLWAPAGEAHRDTRASLTDVGREVEAFIRDVRPKLAVIDPTAGAFAANENDRAAVRGWLSHLGALASETGAAAVLIAHPSRQHGDHSGSTDWRGGVRSLWTLGPEAVPGRQGAPDTKGGATAAAQGRALTLDKANYARDGRRAWLKLRVDPGPDPDAPPDLMRWEEATAREAAEAYHKWRGWNPPAPSSGRKGARTGDRDAGDVLPFRSGAAPDGGPGA